MPKNESEEVARTAKGRVVEAKNAENVKKLNKKLENIVFPASTWATEQVRRFLEYFKQL